MERRRRKLFRKTFGIIKNPLQVSDNETPLHRCWHCGDKWGFWKPFHLQKRNETPKLLFQVEERFCRPLLSPPLPQQGKMEKKEKKWENILLSLANRLTNYNKRILCELLKTELKKRKYKKEKRKKHWICFAKNILPLISKARWRITL